MIHRQVCLITAAMALAVCWARTIQADSALELLSGFDSERIEASYPAVDDKSTGELAKLLYRLRNADAGALGELAKTNWQPGDASLGDAVSIDGTVVSARLLKVPSSLVDVLEFENFQEVTIDSMVATAGETISLKVVAPTVAGKLTAGDRVSGIGVAIELTPDSGPAVATGRLKWFPEKPPTDSWRMLSEHGVDVSAIAEINARDRKPLMAADADAFYPMLAAAQRVSTQADVPAPTKANPIELLKFPHNYSGHWLSMRVDTVRVTRVSVTQPERQQQLGSDHYYQIDAKGDLGKKIVQLDRAKGAPGDPIQFANTYPVSLVITELPDFLIQEISKQEGDSDSVVAMVSMPVQVEGFFFRLWSYSSDYMERQGGGDQFGPLLIGARLTHTPAPQGDPMGIRVIGYVAAATVILGILATIFWSRSNTRQDDQERKKRRDREAEDLQLPGDM